MNQLSGEMTNLAISLNYFAGAQMMELKQEEAESKRTTPCAKDFLNGQSPHERARQKRKQCINWIYRWGVSSGPLLSQVAGVKQSVAGKMEKAGLIIGTKTEAGGITKGTPAIYYTLTRAGLEEAERHATELRRYPEIDRFRVVISRPYGAIWIAA